MRTYFIHASLIIGAILFSSSCGNRQPPPGPMKQYDTELLAEEVRANLKDNILPLWSDIMIDPQGGFYSTMNAENQVNKEAARGGIQNARILWTFSAAFNVLQDSAWIKSATHARDYIHTHFLDNEYGGAYMSLTSRGHPLDTRKHIYTQAFFIYGLAEYYRAAGDRESLEKAIDIFNLIEKHSFDTVHNGYFELFTRDWQIASAEVFGGESENDVKGMNTHIHLLEAYTSLYRSWPDDRLAKQLRNLIVLFCVHFIHEKNHHLIIYFNETWEPTKTYYSFGHDIELSWLLVEAARILGDDELLAKVNEISIKMVEATSEGLQPDGSMIYEKDPMTGDKNYLRSYWTQAETIAGFINAYELTGNQSYLEIALNCWNYTKKFLIDHENGGWYASAPGPGSRKTWGAKAGFWKGPYHHSRMCMEIINRTAK